MSDSTPRPEPLTQAIVGLLGALPQKWNQVDFDQMTATEQEALKLLTSAGFVERRLSVRVRLLGHPVCITATMTVTGEGGLAEATDPVVHACWRAWADEYGKHVGGGAEERPRLHCERIGSEQVRLTDQGVLALDDVHGGKAQMVVDFVRRQGLPFAFRRVVPGKGRADSIHTETTASPTPLDVKVTNLTEVSNPLAAITELLGKLLEQKAAGAGAGAAPATRPSADTERSADDFVFRYEPGGHWLVVYEGRRVGLFPDELGFRYVYELLRIEGRSITAVRLRQHVRRMPVGKAIVASEEAADADLTDFADSDQVVDPQTLRKIREARDDLESRRSVAEDPVEAAELGEQIERLTVHLNRATGAHGNPRPMRGNRLKQAADAVRSRIGLAIDKILHEDRACGQHLLNSVNTGTSLSYRPSPKRIWILT